MEAIQKEALDMLVSDTYTTLAKRNKLGMIHNQKRVSA
jgi:truncated hemoglobin YjbI